MPSERITGVHLDAAIGEFRARPLGGRTRAAEHGLDAERDALEGAPQHLEVEQQPLSVQCKVPTRMVETAQ